MALKPALVLVGGGVRSGKSAFALTRAMALGDDRVFIATAQAFDDEMRARIALHQRERAETFRTLEAPMTLTETLLGLDTGDVVLVDCLTLFVSNLLCADLDDAEVSARFDALLDALETRTRHVVLVTNEVGLGIVPDNALSRRFRDHAGTLHRRIAAIADEVYFATMGVVLRLVPSPVETIVP
jgi:adenosylcobinamide kinase/adenosylcobinamide-phosphate guanylyltransferase